MKIVSFKTITKSLREMAELELKLTGSEEVNFEDVYGYYMVIV